MDTTKIVENFERFFKDSKVTISNEDSAITVVCIDRVKHPE